MHSFTEQQIKETLKIIESSIVNCEKVQLKKVVQHIHVFQNL